MATSTSYLIFPRNPSSDVIPLPTTPPPSKKQNGRHQSHPLAPATVDSCTTTKSDQKHRPTHPSEAAWHQYRETEYRENRGLLLKENHDPLSGEISGEEPGVSDSEGSGRELRRRRNLWRQATSLGQRAMRTQNPSRALRWPRQHTSIMMHFSGSGCIQSRKVEATRSCQGR
ncbi:uncharacterized protein G2W53_000899 [Senna tora]|uniref:Uncharacterized protein n=1 Tax=Senna tora TaxID=362788 RepID=A0A834XGL8_9FABA|nr:uncharacterized protein G2W53_000899 [Senna tora]